MALIASQLVYDFTEEQIWGLPKGVHSVMFDDDVAMELTRKQIIISWYYWEMYRTFPGAKIISKGCVSGSYTSSTHKKLGGLLFWHIFYEHEHTARYSIWDISKAFYEVTNILYIISCTRLSEYPTSTSIHDLIEILDAPEIVQAKEAYKKVCADSKYAEHAVSPEIKKVHKAVANVLYTEPRYLPHNGIKKLCMAGLVNRGQMMQLIGPRGYVEDINGYPFPYPIDVGYSEGLSSLYDSMTESRSASRASIMNTDPLQQSEWFNRKVQLAATVIESVEYIEGGCTGYETIHHFVEPDDLTLLQGKYYMPEGSTTPELIWNSIDHLIGQPIELRTITGCGCHDVQKVCQVCLGWSSYIIPPGTNLGFAIATPLCALISQLIMSTKHYEGSSVSKKIELNASSSRWFRTDPKHPYALFLTPQAVNGNVLIKIESEYVRHLAQIMHVDISELPPTRLTKIPEFWITHTDKTGELMGPMDKLQLAVSGVGVHLTPEVLTYLKEHGWGNGKGYIEFNLKNWNPNVPVFIIPRKGDNIMAFFNEVKSFIEPEKKTEHPITKCKTRGHAVSELITILRRRLNKANNQEFNIIQVEIFIRSMMMVDFYSNRFELPHPSQEFHFMGLKQVIINRSLTSMMAYQEQYTSLLDINWQINEQKTRHLLDPILQS